MPVVDKRGETRVNTNLNDVQEDSSIAYLADGGWIVTWTSNDRTAGGGQNIYQQRYAADGARVGVETRVNDTIPNAQYQSSVAALKGGGWVVVWTSVGSDGSLDVYARCYNAFGKEVTGDIPVNSPSATAQYTPSVIGLSNGGWLVTWSSNGQDGSDAGVYQKRYTAQGQEASAEEQVNSTTGNAQRDPVTVHLNGGGWIVVWESINPVDKLWGVYQQRYNEDGTKRGGEVKVNGLSSTGTPDPVVTALEDGGWLVTWIFRNSNSDAEDIYQQRFAAGGDAAGKATLVNTTTAAIQSAPSVAGLADGGWVVTWISEWQDGSSFGIIQQRYNVAGQAVGGEIIVNTTTEAQQGEPAVTSLSDGGWVVTWSSDSDIYQQRFSAEGQKVGPTTPTGLILTGQPVAEGAAISTPAGQLKVKALEPGNDYTFTLLNDDGGRFALSASGAITVKDGFRIDYEQAQSHRIKVQVKDSLGASYEQWVEIQVADVASENLTGTAAADTFYGGQFADIFRGSGGNDRIAGGSGNDQLGGDLGNDELSGDSGNDRINGGLGNDLLQGGVGKDVFVFDTRANKRTNVDKITDFRSQDDSIHLDNLYFTKLGSGTASKPKKFKSDMFVQNNKAKDAEDRIVYDKKSGKLYYDQDGTGSKAQIHIATLTNKTKLAYHDFYVI
ncbi:M10 family metallopeptidase C-terminal domain-containing protein [Microvirga soli]|uniref:M10 family metallopeptidase C-terminal domain-containing protein n=1 Tax=Microvirga soli TaxID=1854496 RepID=UPI00191DF732|nr:hypothetical protein [Microvirga soli]